MPQPAHQQTQANETFAGSWEQNIVSIATVGLSPPVTVTATIMMTSMPVTATVEQRPVRLAQHDRQAIRVLRDPGQGLRRRAIQKTRTMRCWIDRRANLLPPSRRSTTMNPTQQASSERATSLMRPRN